MEDRERTSAAPPTPDPAGEEVESVLTSPADVASAGRSCMAIIVLGAIILLLLFVWIGYRAVGGQ